MIEKIVEILETYNAEPGEALHYEYWKEHRKSLASKILSLITTEIEEVELPKYKKSWTSDGEKFEDCLAPVTPEDTRQSILNLLKEQK